MCDCPNCRREILKEILKGIHAGFIVPDGNRKIKRAYKRKGWSRLVWYVTSNFFRFYHDKDLQLQCYLN